MHQKRVVTSGKKVGESDKVLIMLHGRGASAQDILSLSTHLNVKDFTLLAPQATNNTWYPYSFMHPDKMNEPWLSSALVMIKEIVTDLEKSGIQREKIYFLGFSQGACLTLEFITQNAGHWGGAVAFTGGLIGEVLDKEKYKGDFQNTPVFIGTSNPDAHVPVERVKESELILKELHADVTVKIYDNMGHTINQDEIENVNRLIFK